MNGRIPVSSKTRYDLKEFQSKMHCKTLEKALQLLLEKALHEPSIVDYIVQNCDITHECAIELAKKLFEQEEFKQILVKMICDIADKN